METPDSPKDEGSSAGPHENLSEETLMLMLGEEFSSIQSTERELEEVLQQRNRFRHAAVEQLGRLPVKNVEHLMNATRRVMASLPRLEADICDARERINAMERELSAGDTPTATVAPEEMLLKKAEEYLSRLKKHREAKSIVINYLWRNSHMHNERE